SLSSLLFPYTTLFRSLQRSKSGRKVQAKDSTCHRRLAHKLHQLVKAHCPCHLLTTNLKTQGLMLPENQRSFLTYKIYNSQTKTRSEEHTSELQSRFDL